TPVAYAPGSPNEAPQVVECTMTVDRPRSPIPGGAMALSPLAGKPAPRELLIDVDRLLNEYATRKPDPADPRQRVSFGTSGHRGTPEDGSFTAAHIVAITQAICEYRAAQGITGPVFMGKDT